MSSAPAVLPPAFNQATPPPVSQHSQFVDPSSSTAQSIAALQVKLDRKLGPEYISQRPGPSGGPKLTYAESWKIINLANEVFGFNGWSSSVLSISVDYMDFQEQSQRYNIGVTAVVRITLRDGVFHEDIGYGMLDNAKSKGGALDKCKKEAVTDATKRALRNFGNLLGNCLYDKTYTAEIVKVKVPPVKFDIAALHRPAGFEGHEINRPPPPKLNPTNAQSAPQTILPAPGQRPIQTPAPNTPTRPPAVLPSKSISALPSHMRPQPPKSAPSLPTPDCSTTSFSASNVGRPQQGPAGYPPLAVGAGASKVQGKTTLTNAHPQVDGATDPDVETYQFGSDDDAFFANLDLSAIPMYDPDDRPINADESSSHSSADSAISRAPSFSGIVAQSTAPPLADGLSRSTLSTSVQAQNGGAHLKPATSASKPITVGHSGQQAAQPPLPQNHLHPAQPQNRTSAPLAHVTGVPASYSGFAHPKQLTSAANLASGAVRPSSPGGFNFPVGANPLQSGGSLRASSNPAYPTVPLKRTSDAMSSGGWQVAGNAPGRNRGQGHAARQPLVPLNRDGTDPKRLKQSF